MANSGWADHASGEQLCCGAQGEVQLLREEQPSPVAVRRRPYVIRSSEPAQIPAVVKTPPAPRHVKPDGMLGRSVQAQIGRMLRDVFSTVADEPVPRRFAALLDALEAKEKQS